MTREKNRVLIAIDGSEQSMNAVRYVSRLLSSDYTEAVLFHVYSQIPVSVLDLKPYEKFDEWRWPFDVWSAHEQKRINKFITQASNIMMENGFDRNKIRVKTQPKQIGFARDILHESKQGYDAIVIGRTGMGDIPEISIGSVANKIIEKAKRTAVVVVGGTPDTENILIANDGSDNAMKAVLRFGALIKSSGVNVMICHVIRALNAAGAGDKKVLSSKEESEWQDEMKRQFQPVIDDIKYQLVNSGFQWSRIDSKIVSSEISRAACLVKEAKAINAGTMVLGRRGITVVKEFFMGRVSHKVIQLADKMAVWIV